MTTSTEAAKQMPHRSGILSSLLRRLGLRKRRRRDRSAAAAIEAPDYAALKALGADEWRAIIASEPVKAAHWLRAAAVYGDIDAQMLWAQLQLDGRGTPRDPESARRWFAIAAESGRADALNMLGRCHELGWGGEADPAEAARCYREAADRNHDWGRFNLASLMLEGRGVPRDPQAAFALFAKAAAQGHAKAATALGRIYELGLGRAPDEATAEGWYRRGAEGGDCRGRYHLGALLLARGETRDALHWLRLAIADDAPTAFCAAIAPELLTHPDPRVREIGQAALAQSAVSR